MRVLKLAAFYAITVAVACTMVLPFLWMVMASFKTKAELYESPLALPRQWRWENFGEAWRVGSLGTYAWNSLLVTGISVAGILLVASMAAYALARLEFRGRAVVLGLLLLGLVLPVQSYFLSLDWLLGAVGLKRGDVGFTAPLVERRVVLAHLCLVLPYIALELPVAVFILSAFFRTLPRDLEDSARLDGCSTLGVYRHVMLPLVRPALATVAIIATLATWNEFLLAQTFLVGAGGYEDLYTLPIGLNAFRGAHSSQDHLILAALSIVTLPTLLVYFLFQRHIVGGLTAGALKG